MNKIFPTWRDANRVIAYLLNKSYGLNYSIDFENINNAIKLSLLELSSEDLKLIPVEYQCTFQDIVLNFTKQVLFKTGLNLEKYLFMKFNDSSLNKMVSTMKIDIKNFEMNERLNIKDELGKALGYSSYNNVKLKATLNDTPRIK